jgi:methionyl-tRNA synthetase
MVLAVGDLQVPSHVITNEFYRLEGQKFSTSRGHAIWGGEFLRSQPADAVRFYLCLAGPEIRQTSFYGEEFTRTTSEVLGHGLHRWTEDLLGSVAREHGGVVPEHAGTPADKRLVLAHALPDRVAAALAPDSFSLREAAAAIREVVVAMPGALADLGSGGGRPAALADHVEALARVAAAAAPLMPFWAGLVLAALGVPDRDPLGRTPPWPESGTRLVPAGRRIAPSCATPLRALA